MTGAKHFVIATNRGPTRLGADDDTIRLLAQVEGQVRRRVGGRLRDFQLTLSPTGLILRGKASSFHVKQVVQHLVMSMLELAIAANEIEVD